MTGVVAIWPDPVANVAKFVSKQRDITPYARSASSGPNFNDSICINGARPGDTAAFNCQSRSSGVSKFSLGNSVASASRIVFSLDIQKWVHSSEGGCKFKASFWLNFNDLTGFDVGFNKSVEFKWKQDFDCGLNLEVDYSWQGRC